MKISRHLVTMLILLGCAAPAFSQPVIPTPVRTVSLSGPRIGFTTLSDGIMEELQRDDTDLRPLITQFGWQFEKQFYTKDGALTAVNEWIVLFGGLEQGIAIPSLSWMVGLRTREGAEFGIGPNVSPAGVALALAAGLTFKTGGLNIPVNVAVVPSSSGARVSMLTGFNFRR